MAAREERTQKIDVLANRRFAAATVTVGSDLIEPTVVGRGEGKERAKIDVHRIAPREEVVLDAATLRARLAETDDARIDEALQAHALQERSPTGFGEKYEETLQIRTRRRPRGPSARSEDRSLSGQWVAATAVLGLALGIVGGLAGC